MPTPNTSAFAIGQFNKFANDIEALRTIAFFYLSAFPEYAEAATLGVNKVSSLPNAAPKEDSENNGDAHWTWVHVPEDSKNRWSPATYSLTLQQIRHWMKMYKSNYHNGFCSGKVAAIKACRNEIRLGLKGAKDLCEYLATKEW